MDPENVNLQGQLKCTVCNTTFTNQSYYDIHSGTKKHKRNLKSARKAVYDRGFGGQAAHSSERDPLTSFNAGGVPAQKPLELSDLTGLCDYKGVRENYRQKNTKYFEDYYTSYVSSVVALWAIKLTLNPTVQDFQITINDKNWDDFGHAVVEIQFKSLPEKPSFSTRCAVHFKHIGSNNVKSLDSFSEGRFSFEGIAKQVGKIQGKTGREIEDTRFLVFTTSAPGSNLSTALTVRCCQGCCKPAVTCKCPVSTEGNCDCQEATLYARTFSNRRNLILNTSEDNESVYRFYPKVHTYELPKIYIYSCQKKLRDLPSAIEESISDALGENRVHVARELIKYVENWGTGNCGGFYKLQKEDVLVKLGQIILTPFRVTPKSKVVEAPATRFAIWIQAIKSVDVTVLKSTADLSKLVEPFDLLIEEVLALKINTTHDTVTIVRTKKQDDTKKMTNSILRAYLLEETLRNFENDIPLEEVYLIFWKAGLMPLMLRVKNAADQDYVFQVISLLKYFGLTRRYLVQTVDGNIHACDIKTLKPLTFFVNLCDVSDKLGPRLLDDIRIGVTEHFSISLTAINQSDPFFNKTVCASELFDMVLGKYVFKSFNYGIRGREDENTKLILSNELMTRLKQELDARINENSHAMVREKSRNDIIPYHWLRGVNPNSFC